MKLTEKMDDAFCAAWGDSQITGNYGAAILAALAAAEHVHEDRMQCPVYGCPWSVCALLVGGDHDCADPTDEGACYYGQDRW